MYLLRENGGNPEILSKIEKIDTVSEEGENICGISERINDIYIAGDRMVLIKYVADYDAYYDMMEDAAETDAAPANGCVIWPSGGTGKIYRGRL